MRREMPSTVATEEQKNALTQYLKRSHNPEDIAALLFQYLQDNERPTISGFLAKYMIPGHTYYDMLDHSPQLKTLHQLCMTLHEDVLLTGNSRDTIMRIFLLKAQHGYSETTAKPVAQLNVNIDIDMSALTAEQKQHILTLTKPEDIVKYYKACVSNDQEVDVIEGKCEHIDDTMEKAGNSSFVDSLDDPD